LIRAAQVTAPKAAEACNETRPLLIAAHFTFNFFQKLDRFAIFPLMLPTKSKILPFTPSDLSFFPKSGKSRIGTRLARPYQVFSLDKYNKPDNAGSFLKRVAEQSQRQII